MRDRTHVVLLSLVLGAVMGIGKAAVYKHIPDYFPQDVGGVGGIVGVLGGLGHVSPRDGDAFQSFSDFLFVQ